MPIPRSSADYYRRQQRILAQLLLAVRQVWRRMDPRARWDAQYTDDSIGAQLLMLVAAAQVAATRDADAYIAAVLAELDLVDEPAPGVVVPAAFAGVAGDGRPVESLLGLVVPRAGQAFNARRREAQDGDTVRPTRPDGMSDVAWESLVREWESRRTTAREFDLQRAAEEALADAGQWLEAVAAAVVIDAARAAESAATAARPEVTGFVRMLNPPSCSRCVILAGRWYRWSDGFDRHPPTCDCRHIPASEAIAQDLTVNPDAYFHSLSRAEQDRIFTEAGARAIRDGADMNQVVNARRGMRRAQVYGRDVVITTEGTTRRGIAFESLSRRGTERLAEELVTRQTTRGPELRRVRRERAKAPRLMPESIYEIADGDRDEVIRLLQAHGYIHRYQ